MCDLKFLDIASLAEYLIKNLTLFIVLELIVIFITKRITKQLNFFSLTITKTTHTYFNHGLHQQRPEGLSKVHEKS